MTPEEQAFKEKLDNTHMFPGTYIFKFIVKPLHQQRVEQLVPDGNIKLKPSSGNKYISVTIDATMNSSEEIIEVYREAKKIEGIISL